MPEEQSQEQLTTDSFGAARQVIFMYVPVPAFIEVI